MKTLQVHSTLRNLKVTDFGDGDNVAYVYRRTGEIHWFVPDADLVDVPESIITEGASSESESLDRPAGE